MSLSLCAREKLSSIPITPSSYRNPWVAAAPEIVAELYMPLLFVRDCDSGDGFGVGQIPNSCYGVTGLPGSWPG
ncbi:hypothetical protein CMV_019944 [Castanea mollissima]|uniref:Uncharacterized protein n=1 Tax=Castanea mollissima TaxID=60419 RepID=A0A8J4QMB1_9ROSI|nr:hypothetical protein CMV_019944 [Castanea mollissima]